MNKQRLQQKQQQNLSPLQIQFLGLLQIPIEALEKRIEKELEENPTLEEDETEDPVLLPKNTIQSRSSEDFSKIQIEDKQESFSDYLHQQLIDLNIDENQKFLVSYLINSLDDFGFLNRELHAISSDLLVSHELIINKDDLLSALATLQKLDPIGVGAKNLQECLLIQLKTSFPKNKIAFTIINDFYTAFSNKNFEHLIKKLKINTQKLKNIYLLIESLNPIPSNGFSKENTPSEYITADFIVNIKDSNLELILNKNNQKSLKVSKYYIDLLENTTDKETISFLKEKIDKAKWFQTSLIKREDTLKKVMAAILNIQEKFFLNGDEKSLNPMRLVDVAEIVNMDISTISRVSNSKYVEAPFGTFKLKDLFSEAYRKDNGEIISTKEIKKRLKEIIDSEDKNQPYTDEELSNLLGKDEYHIARRTVSKYRENLNIQTAKLRRELG